jgi:hypothetical protein
MSIKIKIRRKEQKEKKKKEKNRTKLKQPILLGREMQRELANNIICLHHRMLNKTYVKVT